MTKCQVEGLPGLALSAITGATAALLPTLRSPRSGELEKLMTISRNLADALHRVVDHLPVREEKTALELHDAVEAEVETPKPETEPETGEVSADE
jgi:hypothetical protein